MTLREGVGQQLEQASALAMQEREQLWNAFASNEDAKARLSTFDRRFLQAAAGVSPQDVPQSAGLPDRELVAALNSVTTGAKEVDQLESEAGRTRAELSALEDRGKKFWIWVIAILVLMVVILAAVILRH